MALTMSIAVVEGLSGKQVASRLDAELTEETVSFHAAVPAVSTQSRYRTVVLDDPYDDAPALEDEHVLARLSRVASVALFQVNEHLGCGLYMAGCWADGVMAWKVTHCREEPETEELEVLGVPPVGFAAIAGSSRAKQAQADAAADATGDYICHLGGAVVDLFALVTGIEFYSPSPGWWEKLAYSVLRPRNEGPGTGRSWDPRSHMIVRRPCRPLGLGSWFTAWLTRPAPAVWAATGTVGQPVPS
jgi:hypothetical protein